ncbi:D-arabinono-1,4-lactone oxidase [Labedella endophytica]|uniref:FAD-binding protein n=1 Tax=Labedella endophytica TaxID=1523160 RepID=A0A3S0X5P2_9MICO|nr:D-arabinono-1,4-lactone oxidase [Labedella endophytica]RUQ99186.1 FAD-binding protein [Labedella endophytica]
MTATGALWRNWARTESARPIRVERPSSPGAVARAVRAAAGSGLPIKAAGSGHSFTGIAVAPGVLLELDDLTGLVSVDRDRRLATILAGTRLSDVSRLLAPHGLALENLGDIDRQTISGAISTGTHGTGIGFAGLAARVRAVTLVTGDGSLRRFSADESPELLPAVSLGLGALGVLVDVTIECVDAFVVSAVEAPEPLDATIAAAEQRARSADHFEFYWFPHTRVALTKTNTRLPAGGARAPLPRVRRLIDDDLIANGVYRAVCATGTVLPVVVPTLNRAATKLTGSRRFADHSHRVFTTSRTVRFAEMEYAVPVDALPSVLEDLAALIAVRRWRISFPLEIRFAAADDLWLSTASGRESAYIAVHRYHRERHEPYFRAAEEIFRNVGGRPHWGKIHYLGVEELRTLYPRFDDFLALRDELDPRRAFANPYLDRVLGP